MRGRGCGSAAGLWHRGERGAGPVGASRAARGPLLCPGGWGGEGTEGGQFSRTCLPGEPVVWHRRVRALSSRPARCAAVPAAMRGLTWLCLAMFPPSAAPALHSGLRRCLFNCLLGKPGQRSARVSHRSCGPFAPWHIARCPPSSSWWGAPTAGTMTRTTTPRQEPVPMPAITCTPDSSKFPTGERAAAWKRALPSPLVLSVSLPGKTFFSPGFPLGKPSEVFTGACCGGARVLQHSERACREH